MSDSERAYNSKSHFYLNKWFLDYIGENGDCMIFYAAELIWRGIKIPYSSWLQCNSSGIVKQKSRIHSVRFPEINIDKISWADLHFGISGEWQKTSDAVQSHIFESDEGALDWMCHQPSSICKLEIQGKQLTGKGYAEQLILTIPAWKIPMDGLRWGHVVSKKHQLVWIELIRPVSKKWLWLNGKLTENFQIDDSVLSIPGRNLTIHFDKSVVLESEKKLKSLADKLSNIIPGLKRLIPMNFLMADEKKCLSQCSVYKEKKNIDSGFAIHEFVNFNTSEDDLES